MNTIYLDAISSLRTIEANDLHCDKKLCCQLYENAIILPYKKVKYGNGIGGGIIDSDGHHISIVDIGEMQYSFDSKDVEDRHESVVYLGLFHPIWGHCITDNIKKIWFLFSDDFKNLYKNKKIKFVYSGFDEYEPNGNFKELLRLLGVDADSLMRIKRPTRFDEIYVPDDSLIYKRTSEFEPTNCNVTRLWTNEFKGTFDKLLSGIEKKTSK